MESDPPVKRNFFLIAVVILFNMIWLMLLFLSCQADENRQLETTPTPQALELHILEQNEYTAEESRRKVEIAGLICPIYNGQLTNPPSTWSITPEI